MSDRLEIHYKLFLDAEDISQSRILSTAENVKGYFAEHENRYISRAVVENDSDMDEFVLQISAIGDIVEEKAESAAEAESFLDEFAELAATLAHVQSFFEMEGSFSIQFEGESIAYTFSSPAGSGNCDFEETAFSAS